MTISRRSLITFALTFAIYEVLVIALMLWPHINMWLHGITANCSGICSQVLRFAFSTDVLLVGLMISLLVTSIVSLVARLCNRRTA